MSPFTLSKVFISATAAIVATTLSAGIVHADDPYEELLTGLSCNVTDVTAEGLNATDCAGAYATDGVFSPNDVLGDGNPLLGELNTMFDVDYDWLFIDKDDSENSADTGMTWDTTGEGKGTWSFLDGIGKDQVFAISLKTSTSFSVYYFDLGIEVDSGLWDTIGTSLTGNPRNPTGRDLSHFSLFIADKPDEPDTKVPEPGMVLGLGLFAAGSLRKLRRTRDV
ncbi:MAG: hypothetical protein MH825_15290 [Cyanobacteria bacterium]|nr:hypothetical protein [Cyanobacteriota bacterium]